MTRDEIVKQENRELISTLVNTLEWATKQEIKDLLDNSVSIYKDLGELACLRNQHKRMAVIFRATLKRFG